MKVTLAQHGGLAAAIHLRRPPQVVDTAALSAEDAAHLARLVTDAARAPVPPEAARGQARDAMSYTIAIDDGGQTVLSQSDSAMSEPFARLLAWLQRRR